MLEAEARELHGYLSDSRETARQYLKNNDLESARSEDSYAMSLERDLETKLIELQNAGGIPTRENAFTQEKAQFLGQYADQLHRPSWLGVIDGQGRPANNLQAIAYAHERAKALGFEEDSPGYFEAMRVLAPQGEGTSVVSGDEALAITRNSKYGRDLDARTFNKGVHELHRRKAAGDYKDG